MFRNGPWGPTIHAISFIKWPNIRKMLEGSSKMNKPVNGEMNNIFKENPTNVRP